MRTYLVVAAILMLMADLIHAQDTTQVRFVVGSGGGKSTDGQHTTWTITGQCAYAMSNDGIYQHSGGILGKADSLVSSVEVAEDLLPTFFGLFQNYPNPFNPNTTIQYSLPERSQVTIEVFNLLGQKVQTLVDREMSAGSYTISWDGTDGSGKPVATGIYLYRFEAGEHIQTKKMLLLK